MKTNPTSQPPLRLSPLRPALVLLLALAGSYVTAATARADIGVSINVAASSDDYVYYPDSEVYYNNVSHRYIYRNGDRWFTGTQAPRRWNRRAPFVHLDFHDAPQRHHAEISHSYPKHWRPSDRHDNDRRGNDRHNNDRHDNDHRDRDKNH